MKILYIDSTVRECSRTSRLAEHLLTKLDGDVKRIKLRDVDFPVTDGEFLSWREKVCAERDFSHDIFAPARQFAAADAIVISAPYWDLSFPASLKQFFEHINLLGLTFDYTPDGRPVGLCRAEKLYYITTAGGPIYSEEYGFGYVKALAETFYGIKECRLFKAEGLDLYGADIEAIMSQALKQIDEAFEG